MVSRVLSIIIVFSFFGCGNQNFEATNISLTQTLVPTPIQSKAMTQSPIATIEEPKKILTLDSKDSTLSDVESEVIRICQIDGNSTPQVEYQILYFQTYCGDWYGTTDEFISIEQISSNGILSTDLDNRIVYNCDGPEEQLLIANPILVEPEPLSLTTPFPNIDMVNDNAHWLSSDQLVFQSSLLLSPLGKPAELDNRLYLLDLATDALIEITDNINSRWVVSPSQSCVAYVADDGATGRLHITNLHSPYNFESWLAPVVDDPYKWPENGTNLIWSPDGTQLAFTTFSERFEGIVIWNLITNEHKLFEKRGGNINLSWWSPDGKKIHFTASGQKDELAHWILNVETGEKKELVPLRASARPSAYQWLDNERIVVAGVFGSFIINTQNDSVQEIDYPGKERGLRISNMFFGPTP